ncbi:hypothetical protein C7972_11131 [Arenibacter sp. ARW7G5Y1]|nr:hypothetical protein C7972_11131 [Arenibacter sp. ARW7G5Y1]
MIFLNYFRVIVMTNKLFVPTTSATIINWVYLLVPYKSYWFRKSRLISVSAFTPRIIPFSSMLKSGV